MSKATRNTKTPVQSVPTPTYWCIDSDENQLQHKKLKKDVDIQ